MVQKGETVYAIAWRYGLDYRTLADWNAIGPPYLIRPGQQLRIVVPARGAAPSSSRPTAATARGGKSAAKPRPSPARRSPKPSSAAASKSAKASAGSTRPVAARQPADPTGPVKKWRWPTAGRVTRPFRRSGNKGIDISGRKGQSVNAAANGRVVYAGGGLIGYGKLIILKHNKRYLSAYAHNNKLLVQEGNRVRVGQRIAEMGSSGTERVMLHFEIRRDGKPVNPTLYLPKR